MKCEQFLGLQKKLNQPQRSIIQVKNKGSDTDAYLITIPTWRFPAGILAYDHRYLSSVNSFEVVQLLASVILNAILTTIDLR